MFDKLIHHYYRRQLKDKRYEFLYDTHPDELVSFDCETTSLISLKPKSSLSVLSKSVAIAS
ncbi:hypothetical protein [Moraxella catarrhalis]|uniref:hypothetical protein n=1 Tax=Moraxella catarrhalis TaxID=480 RepID=UPI001C5AE484|nr:hypothetical protein [Moraxella catarrhalis]